MENTVKIVIVILLTACPVFYGALEEATISAETLLLKAGAILKKFPEEEKLTRAFDEVTKSTDLESAESKAALNELGITDKDSSAAKLLSPYEQEKKTNTIVTWLKNYETNNKFYTNPDQQAALKNYQETLRGVEKSQELAAKLNTYLAQHYKK